MDTKYLSADSILSPNGNWQKDQVIATDLTGKIVKIDHKDQFRSADINYNPGTLVPGFINAHCHLELSHMKGQIPTGTGLVPFIKTVVSQREASPESIQSAIESADREMMNSGIVAVGDISNATDSFHQKSNSQLRYFTFIEVFDFMQAALAEEFFQKSWEVFDRLELKKGDAKSLVPHAPYSVSNKLFQLISAQSTAANRRLSIHNQELEDENRMFQTGESQLIDFFESAGFDMSAFQPTGKNSLSYILDNIDFNIPTLFVHNTQTTEREIARAKKLLEKSFWITCPNANLYIENQLPDYNAFIDQDAYLAIGTDSLASNWQLSILEEIKTIKKYNSYIPTSTLLTWATKNGARALGYEDELGTFEVGKTPGILHLSTSSAVNWEINENTEVNRLI